MLIHPWDAAGDREWRAWLADGREFGQLIAVDEDARPVVVPTPFLFDGDETVLLHLARPNPIWPALELRGTAMLTVVDDYTHVPGTWRPPDNEPAETGVPTEYYAAVQLSGPVDLVDDPAAKAELLRRQLSAYGMSDDLAPVDPDGPPYGRMLSGIRGVVLHVREVRAKFKFDDKRTVELQRAVSARLAERDLGRDRGARRQQLRRLDIRTDDSYPA
ncbi:MAG TPA: FMN-binding negative transcriptional regulator [Pseudonocardiaceae bacterium]|jgi:transcriptional regulator|nr:FMN-binding negative transcriptional regulator [Pseudonocardiaceae bacterium]